MQRVQRVHQRMDWLCNRTRFPLRQLIAKRLARRLLPPLGGPIRCPTIYGFDLQVRRGDGENYYYKGFYEPGTIHVLERCLRPGDVFVDGGASVGLMTLYAASRVGPSGRVLAFEPHPDRYADLVAGIRFGDWGNVTALQLGIGDEPTSLALYESVSPSMVHQSGAVVGQVDVVRLDDVLAREGISEVRMLKLDVEGFEGRALEGARGLLTGAEPPIVCFEYGVHTDRLDPVEVLRETGSGYEFYQLRRTKTYASDLVKVDPKRLRAHDNIFAITPSQASELAGDLICRS